MKTPQHSTKPKKLTKALARKEVDQELCTSLNQKRFWPISEERVMALAADLKLMYEENPRMITVIPWREKHNIHRNDVYAWMDRFPKFKDEINEIKDRMGWRVLQFSHRDGDLAFAKYVMPMYSTDFKELEEWRSNLRKDAEGKGEGTTINLVMPDFGESGRVPDRIKKEVAKNNDS